MITQQYCCVTSSSRGSSVLQSKLRDVRSCCQVSCVLLQPAKLRDSEALLWFRKVDRVVPERQFHAGTFTSTSPIGGENPLYLGAGTSTSSSPRKLMDKGEAGLYHFGPAAEHEEQCLCLYICHEPCGGEFGVYYGVGWEKEVARDSRLNELAPVKRLRKRLQSLGFKTTYWSLGYKAASEYETVDDFLAAVASDQRAILHEIGDVFLPLVEETAKMLEEENQAVVAAGKR